MALIDEHHDHDMGEYSMCRDPHDMGESSMHLDAQVDNQMVILPEHLQHPDDSDEFQHSPNGTPYWVPDVPEDEKPKKGRFFDNFNDAFEMYQGNRAGKPRMSKEVNTLNEVDGEDVEIPGNKKRKRRTKSQAINCPAKLCLKRIIGTETYRVLDFVENHNHPLMNLNNMNLSKARRQLHFDDYIFIHRASLSNLGPTRAHRLKFCACWDAQMLVDKMFKRKKHVPDFSFEYHTLPSKELVRLFWADETMKCNYNAFGDVVSFDATFHTNKYGYKFIPFTGIDHHQKCVTFGAALLSDETTESFSWMLEAFLKTHKKQPPFAVTDQDGALRNAVVKMFPDSHHRLCMWHITEKLPGKVLGDLAADTKFRKDFHKLVWNVYIGPEVFEQRWDDMITREVQHEIRKSLYACTQIRNHSEGGVETCIIRHRDKRSNTVIDATNDTDKLSELLSMVKVLKKKLEDETHTPNVDPNKEDLYADMLGVTVPDKVVIKTPRSIFRSKGTRRIKSAAEIGKAKTIARTNRKVPFKRRTCSKCGGKGHNKATCKGCNACGEAGHHKGLCKKFPNQDKDEVDDEDEGDNEDEVDDENGVDNEDELDEDEDDEEYISEEE
ncbi:FAR1-related sequence 5-like protein [Tanacetum coccineum]|uniref:FAR1-related sequence 5-like protein n=1 Tax=Tanacetum coccineum TaxID=301880 RepID=A0ABQ4Z4V8_9ASTR